MKRKLNRSPEEMARREKLSEILQALEISSMDDIKELYRQTIVQFMENSLGSKGMKVWNTSVTTKPRRTHKQPKRCSQKMLKTSFGDTEIAVPQDRKSEFNPQILKKDQTSISEDLEAIWGLTQNLGWSRTKCAGCFG